MKPKKKGISIIQSKSTNEAMLYLKNHPYLISRPLSGFRVITDWRRTENDVVINDAGKQFIQQMRNLGYQQKIVVYTTVEGKKAVELCSLLNVEATNISTEVSDFGHFRK